KSRVALAKTLTSDANFLLLDEPTNHLDIQSVNVLIQALQQYEGTFLLVSHDRYLVQEVANTIWFIEDGQLHEYPGTYEEYEYWNENVRVQGAKAGDQNSSSGRSPAGKPASETISAAPKQVPNSNGADEHKRNGELKKLGRTLDELEQEIEAREALIRKTEAELAREEVYSMPEKLEEVNSHYLSLKEELEKLNTDWNMLAERITELETQ
ncbi:MAG TPA: ABC transporter ATP-binding protein, partial [Anseongella sp.]